MEVNTMPVCPAYHRASRFFLNNEWVVVEKRMSIPKMVDQAARGMEISMGEGETETPEQTSSKAERLKEKIKSAFGTLRRRKRPELPNVSVVEES